MKLIKIKNLQNSEAVLNWVKGMLIESEDCYSPLVQINNYPNKNFYILIDNLDIIPAYICTRGNEALTLWVHKDYRKKGYAKFMIETLNIKYTTAAPSSVLFWEKMGFKRINSGYGPITMKRV